MELNKEKRVLFILVGFILLVVGIFASVLIEKDKENSIETVGTIIRIESERKKRGRLDNKDEWTYITHVEYEVDGKIYNSTINGIGFNYHTGKKINIYYDKENPNLIGTDSVNIVFYIIFIMGVIAICCGIPKRKIKSRRG